MCTYLCWWTTIVYRNIVHRCFMKLVWFGFMVFNATFSDISVILWWSVLLVEKPEYLEKTTELLQVTDKLYHTIFCWVHLAWVGFELTMLEVLGTDCIGSYKSNNHTITTALIVEKKCQKNHLVYLKVYM